ADVGCLRRGRRGEGQRKRDGRDEVTKRHGDTSRAKEQSTVAEDAGAARALTGWAGQSSRVCSERSTRLNGNRGARAADAAGGLPRAFTPTELMTRGAAVFVLPAASMRTP